MGDFSLHAEVSMLKWPRHTVAQYKYERNLGIDKNLNDKALNIHVQHFSTHDTKKYMV